MSVEAMSVTLRGKKVFGDVRVGDVMKFAATPHFYKAKAPIVSLLEDGECVTIGMTLPNADMASLAEMVFLEGREYTTVEESKAAEPGATDNLDDARRLREDP